MSNYFWGIDPGKSGAICILDKSGSLVAGKLLKNTDRDVFDWVHENHLTGFDDVCVLEKVWAMNKPGSPRQGVSSIFKFGYNYGFLNCCLMSANIPYREIAPVTWKKVMGVIAPKGSTKTQIKRISKLAAQKLFPGIKITNNTAEALLIAEYCRRVWV